MKNTAALLLSALLFFTSCKHQQQATGPVKGDRDLVAEFHPFWGGVAACELERKKGKDVLRYYYTENRNGADTTTNAFVEITAAMADSVFKTADRINWTQPISDGSANPKTGMKIDLRYKKGNIPLQMHWEKMNSISELPDDVESVLHLMNDLAPAEFKMY